MLKVDLFVIYDHPKDFPKHFVVRQWIATDDGNGHSIDPPYALADSLSDARACLPRGLACIGRNWLDDPVIVEVWIW